MTEIIDATGLSFDIETACVVVGAGACGLVAALALADAEIETLVLERDTKATGSTSMSSGFIPAASTRLQKSSGVSDSPAQFAKDIQRKANNEADPSVVDAVTSQIGPVLDWLEQTHQLEWRLLDDFLYPGHTAHRMHAVPEKTGAGLHQRLLAACERAGVNIATSALVDALIVVDSSASSPEVCGVRVKRPDGSHEHINCASVILACNGYGANPQLIERFIPEIAKAWYHGHAGNTGDAVYWGEQLNVPLVHMSAYQGHGSLAAGHNILITWALMMEGGVQLNASGVRFSNEHGGYSEQAVHVIRQPGGVAWNIYDQRLHEMGLGFPDYCEAFEAGAVVSAATAQELAAELSLPVQNVCKTLDELATWTATGGTDEYGRDFTGKQTLQSPYYAIKVVPAVFHTQGGLQIDDHARVINERGVAVKNLYAAGGAACGVSGSSVAGYLSGNGLLTAVGLGAIAANTIVNSGASS